jgi:DNA-binding LacI/PurR family transcriptional regulator
MRRHWYMGANLGTARWASSWAELLMHQQDRPDGVIVLDDNLIGPVLEGLANAGMHIGQDIDVVTHCNFPVTQKMPDAVCRIGFDNRQFLAMALNLIQRHREGRPLPRKRRLPAVMEEQLAASGDIAHPA